MRDMGGPGRLFAAPSPSYAAPSENQIEAIAALKPMIGLVPALRRGVIPR
jgi:hypothetical protein